MAKRMSNLKTVDSDCLLFVFYLWQSSYVVQDNLRLRIVLLQPPSKCWVADLCYPYTV